MIKLVYIFYQSKSVFHFQTFVHELRITNQLIYVSPPVEDARVNIMQELFGWEAIVTSLPRIKHSRYQVRSYLQCKINY